MNKKFIYEDGDVQCIEEAKIIFNPVEFAEFLGSKGKDVVIIKERGVNSFRTKPMKVSEFQKYMKEYVESKGVNK